MNSIAIYEWLIRPGLFRLDPEVVHEWAVDAAEWTGRSRVLCGILRRCFAFENAGLPQNVAGLTFAHPLGLAAGFDKNGRAIALMGALGFGHVEIGSVSGYPSAGNPRPRLFRIPQDLGIVVFYCVPNEGSEAVAARLGGHRFDVPLGINLVKTNAPDRRAEEPEVLEDFYRSFARLQDCGDYFTLNLSCPNSKADRDFFDDLEKVDRLLAFLASLPPRRPVFLKLKPTTDLGRLRTLVAIADRYPFVAGFGINLPTGKPAALRLRTPPEILASMPGAVGGRPAEGLINQTLGCLYRTISPGSRYALIAAGGIFTAEDAYRKIRLGATLIQLYTGLVYRGPGIVHDILQGLVRLCERDGFSHISEAIGADWRDL